MTADEDAEAEKTLAATRAGTLPGEAGVARAPAAALESWARYEILGELGAGGMGTVYKARDRQLGRVVALKFILGAHPNLVLRFLQEARAQARLDHPHICRVYEVGDFAGRSYIAMQFVDGRQLGVAAEEMSLDEKVAVMRDVAAAMHEAHKLGIVHRDLKPSNILVTRADDRRWFPVVMDFGLARDSGSDGGLTESGMLLGTPAYMAPEQAHGDQRRVDRRADVYSLGATFYQLLTGRAPFAEASTALVIRKLLDEEPPAPRALVASLPVDLETIALECLEKEPERRYASARALADDLSRYLDGEPILGRRASLWRRLSARARKNRALTAVTAISAAIILVVAGLAIRTALLSRQRARLAESLGQDAKEIEWLLSAAYQLPLHDTTPEHALIKARMQRIAATRHDLGALGDALVHDALGRGYLVLHDWPRADEELARAAQAGLDTPGLHLARGRALGELYHRAIEDARRSADKASLQTQVAAIESRYLTPALAEIERGKLGADAAVVESLLALYRHDYALAEKRALEGSERAPWLIETRRIAADAVYAAAVDKADHGRYDEADPLFARASRLYDAAAEVSRSDATVYEAAAEAWRERADVAGSRGATPKQEIERALAAIDNAITAAPKDARARTTKAYILLLQYRLPALRPRDQVAFLDGVIASAGRAVELDGGDARAWDALGIAHLYRGHFAAQHGDDPLPSWDKARAAVERALAIDPNDPWANNDAGSIHRWLGARLEELGRDPMAEYTTAIERNRRAAALDPQYLAAIANEVDVEGTIAEYQRRRGLDPAAAVDAATRAAKRCLELNPKYNAALYNLIEAQLTDAGYLNDVGKEPLAPLAVARAHLGPWTALEPERMVVHYLGARVAMEEARYRLRGGGAAALLVTAHAEIAHAERLDGEAGVFAAEAELALLDADQAARSSAAALPALERARAAAERALAIDRNDSEAAVLAARACLGIARARRGAAADAITKAAMGYAEAALRQNPNLAAARAVRAELEELANRK